MGDYRNAVNGELVFSRASCGDGLRVELRCAIRRGARAPVASERSTGARK